MGTFTASLRAIGDVKALPATVELSEGRLSIVAGTTEIGSWPLSEIDLEEMPTGYRMAAEGEQILIELKDVASFASELKNVKKRRVGIGRKRQVAPKKNEPVPAAAQPAPAAPQPAPAAPQPAPAPAERAVPQPVRVKEPADRGRVTLPPREERPARTTSWSEKVLAFIDGILRRANKRFGAFLPDWMFTRAMFVIAFGALVLMLVLPGVVSIFLLITGALMILFGAVVYSDPMLASRWLPGRATPQHTLLFGVAILMMGVLLGVIAR